MKKLLTLILALAMVLSLAACGGKKEEAKPAEGDAQASSEPTKMTLILRGGTYGDVIKAALPAFEAEHNVKCEVLDLSFDDLHTKIALNAPNPQGEYDLCMVDGDIYLAPYFGNVTVMLYNKQLIADAGYAPEDIDTFADLMDIAQKTNAAGKKGFLIRGGSGDNIVSDFIPHLLAYGGWVVDENNQPTVNTPEFKAAFENYINLYKLGDTMDKDDIVAAIDNGDAALAQGWPGWYVPSDDSNANYTVIPTKLDDSDTAKNTSMYGVWTIGICNNSQNKELTLKLLEYLMDPETQLASIDLGGVPCRTSCLLNKDVLAKYPHLETVHGALQTGVYRPVIEEWAEFTNILGTEMDAVIQGTKDMDKGLADAQSALEALLA